MYYSLWLKYPFTIIEMDIKTEFPTIIEAQIEQTRKQIEYHENILAGNHGTSIKKYMTRSNKARRKIPLLKKKIQGFADDYPRYFI